MDIKKRVQGTDEVFEQRWKANTIYSSDEEDEEEKESIFSKKEPLGYKDIKPPHEKKKKAVKEKTSILSPKQPLGYQNITSHIIDKEKEKEEKKKQLLWESSVNGQIEKLEQKIKAATPERKKIF